MTVITKKVPSPIYHVPVAEDESRLRKFICASDETPLILAPRRFPAIPCPPNNTDTSIAILTSVGFRQLEAHQYLESINKLKPDIAIGFADLVYGQPPGVKRRGKMVDRTHAYTQDALETLYGNSVPAEQKSKTAYFAPVLPLDNAQQSIYLDDLQDEFHSRISGLALYESASLSYIPESLGDLPRLLLSQPGGPHDLLRDISLGADILTLPFVGECSDAGIALDFTFPAPSNTQASVPKVLGLDLGSSDHAKDTSTLSEGCECYACRNHHRAYFNHLLNAKEMAAWALLQMHNYHTMDLFFAGVRNSIQQGTFEEDAKSFNRAYVSQLPDRTGEGPRYVHFSFLIRSDFTDSPSGCAAINFRPVPTSAVRVYTADLMMFHKNSLSHNRLLRRRIPMRVDSSTTALLRRFDAACNFLYDYKKCSLRYSWPTANILVHSLLCSEAGPGPPRLFLDT